MAIGKAGTKIDQNKIKLKFGNYLVANKYIDTLGDMVKDGKDNKTIYIPYEATGVLSSLGGIKEMFKNQK